MQYSTNLLSEDKSGCNTHQGRRGQFLKEKHKNIILHIMEWKTMEVINTCDWQKLESTSATARFLQQLVRQDPPLLSVSLCVIKNLPTRKQKIYYFFYYNHYIYNVIMCHQESPEEFSYKLKVPLNDIKYQLQGY